MFNVGRLVAETFTPDLPWTWTEEQKRSYAEIVAKAGEMMSRARTREELDSIHQAFKDAIAARREASAEPPVISLESAIAADQIVQAMTRQEG